MKSERNHVDSSYLRPSAVHVLLAWNAARRSFGMEESLPAAPVPMTPVLHTLVPERGPTKEYKSDTLT